MPGSPFALSSRPHLTDGPKRCQATPFRWPDGLPCGITLAITVMDFLHPLPGKRVIKQPVVAEWAAIRVQILCRAGWRCEACGATIEQMRLINVLCRFAEMAER